jgi:hypothetical protein
MRRARLSLVSVTCVCPAKQGAVDLQRAAHRATSRKHNLLLSYEKAAKRLLFLVLRSETCRPYAESARSCLGFTEADRCTGHPRKKKSLFASFSSEKEESFSCF